jgi:hypothetical protein
MSRILTSALFVLTLSAPALADTVPEGVTLRAYEPVGNGDPNAISCWAYRTTPPVRGLQCARNSDWARMNAGTGRFLGDDRGEATFGPAYDPFGPSPRARELSGK